MCPSIKRGAGTLCTSYALITVSDDASAQFTTIARLNEYNSRFVNTQRMLRSSFGIPNHISGHELSLVWIL